MWRGVVKSESPSMHLRYNFFKHFIEGQWSQSQLNVGRTGYIYIYGAKRHFVLCCAPGSNVTALCILTWSGFSCMHSNARWKRAHVLPPNYAGITQDAIVQVKTGPDSEARELTTTTLCGWILKCESSFVIEHLKVFILFFWKNTHLITISDHNASAT